jgi:transcriptional regulator with XRE-family HTH domain
MSNKKFKLDVFPPEHFGTRLKRVRLELNLDTAQISDILRVRKNSYYKYEDGSRFPQPEILLSLITYLNVNVNYLLSGEGEMFLTPPPSSEKEKRISLLKEIFPNIPQETFPLIESLEVPIIKHSLMTEYLLCKEQYKSYIDEHLLSKKKENKV